MADHRNRTWSPPFRADRRSFVAGALASALPMPALAQSARSQTLRFVPQAALAVLDPSFSTAAVTSQHGFHVFDTLYGLDDHMQPQPQMAEGHSVSDDGLTWAIRLREGLLFHDGEPVLARDCVASIKRWMVKDLFGKDLSRFVNSIETADDRTFRFRLKRRFPLLPLALAKMSPFVPFIFPERLAAIDPSKPITEMIGSGPYRFIAREHVPGSRVVYQKFEQYRPRQEAPQGTSGGKVVHLPRVEWTVLPDAATAAAALQAGEVDWWDQVHPDLSELVRRDKNITVSRLDPFGSIPFMRFNSTIPPFNNPALRRIILKAVKQTDYLIAITGGDKNRYGECESFFPCGKGYEYLSGGPQAQNRIDTRAAKAELATEGYNGEKIVIVNPADFPTIAPLGHITYELLKSMDMNVELIDTDWGSTLARVQNRGPADKGGWNVYHTWWGGLSIMIPPTNNTLRGLGANGWTGWYESKDVEDLNDRWLTSDSEDERKNIVQKMQSIAFRDSPSIPLGQFFIDTAYRRNLTGILRPRPVSWNIRRV
ncbi:ABC transporter substrate-binding protein [Bosea sp. 2KB_26]|uniref:ABC transporter substrate-binding protein n=1 Tax=Bosea sp. 2KB_26 TaxID=3237475 RepID=UPI003F93C1A7